jgi:hypothetical protein
MDDMAKTSLTDRRAKLTEKQRQIAEKLKTLDAKAAAQVRKDETRRKVIAGALALRCAELTPEGDFAKQIIALIANEIASTENERNRATLRKLFSGLLPEPKPQDSPPLASALTDVAPALAAMEFPYNKSKAPYDETGLEPKTEPQPYRFDLMDVDRTKLE